MDSASSNEQARDAAGRPRTILIVEDEPLVAKFYCLALQRAGGFACIVSEDVPDILARVAAGEIQAAIVDISLTAARWEGRPIDGVELAQLIRRAAKGAGRHVPMLLASARPLAGEGEQMLAASGADGFLEKPVFDAQELVHRINRLPGMAGG